MSCIEFEDNMDNDTNYTDGDQHRGPSRTNASLRMHAVRRGRRNSPVLLLALVLARFSSQRHVVVSEIQ